MAAKVSSQYWKPHIFYGGDDDDDEESSIPLRDIISVLPLVEDLVPILSESEDTSGSDSDIDLPSCDDFSPINVYEEKSVTFSNPLFNSNDEFTSSDDESLSDEDVSEDNSLLHFEGFIDSTALFRKEIDDLFDLESKTNDWKKILYDAPIDDLMTEDKVFDPGIWEIIFSPTYVKLPFEDRHYHSLTYVIRIFLPYFTYPMESHFLLSSGVKTPFLTPAFPFLVLSRWYLIRVELSCASMFI
ncbi:hypothetical protein Tco_1540010 [Tanacetum coccineum]